MHIFRLFVHINACFDPFALHVCIVFATFFIVQHITPRSLIIMTHARNCRTLTYFAPQRLADEYRVDGEHQPVLVVPAGVARQVAGVRERLELLLSGVEDAAALGLVGRHVRRDDVIVVDRLVQRVFRVSQQLRANARRRNRALDTCWFLFSTPVETYL